MTAADILKDAGHDHTHWGRIIIKAERQGEFTNEDQLASGNWVTCACGKLDKDIPRWQLDVGIDKGRPKDDALVNLGGLFCHAVMENRFTSAAHLLCNIERRAISVVLETVLKASGLPQLPTTTEGPQQHHQQ